MINDPAINIEYIDHYCSLIWTGSNPKDWLSLATLNTLPTDQDFVTGFWSVGKSKEDMLISPLGRMWIDIIKQPFIPFDVNQRREQLAHAYDELAEEIHRWEDAGTYNERLRRNHLS